MTTEDASSKSLNADAYAEAAQRARDAIATGSTSLDLSGDNFYNNLSELPPEVGQIRGLKEFTISKLGSLDASALMAQADLRKLSLYAAQLQFPRHAPHHLDYTDFFPRLTHLRLETKYCRWIPDFRKLPELRRLELIHTDIDDLSPLASCENLEVLKYSGISQDGRLFDYLERCPRLHTLDLSESLFHDAELAEIPRIRGLRALHLDGCRVTEAGLRNLSDLRDLRLLTLDRTQVADLSPLVYFRPAAGANSSIESVNFANTPATERDEVIKGLSDLPDRQIATSILLKYLEKKEALSEIFSGDVAAARAEASTALSTLQTLIGQTDSDEEREESLAPIGHNNPPSDEVLSTAETLRTDLDQFRLEIADLRAKLDELPRENTPEEVEQLRTSFARVVRTGKSLGVWCFKKIDKAVDVAVGIEVTKLVLGETTVRELADALIYVFASVQKLIESLMTAL